ncbi:uncharacterized protein LOC127264384 isoform X2 [Andrographis paniculata]|nr:uncharacterized protein LOC127264384 isoform X2 [Andrographis paniculata]
MEESNQIRKESEPTKLIELAAELKEKIKSEERVMELPGHLKQKFIHEILAMLRSMESSSANTTALQAAIESWRRQTLKEAKRIIRGEIKNSTILPEEAGIVENALSSHWSVLLEEIGLWLPVEIVHKVHDEKPDDEPDYDLETLPGKRPPPECHAELHTDYDGSAVKWGLTHHQESAYDCCMSCLNQAKNAKPGQKKCNIWVYCPSETGCYSPDIYEHKNQECWLKFSETPKLNFKDTYPESYRATHPRAPIVVPWVSGVVST